MIATNADNLLDRFDSGEDVLDYFDEASAVVEHFDKRKQISVSVPQWLVDFLDAEADRRGIARKAVINTALVEWCDEQRERAKRISA